MSTYHRIIEIGGANRPIVPRGLEEYIGIDPVYADDRYHEEATKIVTDTGAMATLLAKEVQMVADTEVGRVDLVIMQNVLGHTPQRRLPVVESALRFLNRGGSLLLLQNNSAMPLQISDIEVAMEAAGHFVVAFGAVQVTLGNYYDDFLLGEPGRTDRMLKITPQPADLGESLPL